jgi:hypothetical protein
VSGGIGTVVHVYDICRCDHESAAHEHYRAGSECAVCPSGECSRYRSTTLVRGWVARLFRTSRIEPDRAVSDRPLSVAMRKSPQVANY